MASESPIRHVGNQILPLPPIGIITPTAVMEKNNLTLYDKDTLLPHFVITDIVMYAVSTCVLVVNGGIVVIYLVQHCRRALSSPISPAGVLVLNLLISDALVGALGIYMTASFFKGITHTKYGCVTRIAMRFLFRMGSHMALINVAVDRYMAIMHTLRYRDWVTMERSLALIGIGWLVPVCGVVYAFLDNDWTPGLSLCSQINSFSIFLTYIRLPAHLLALLGVIVIQCKIYLQLKHYEQVSSHQVLRRYSHKSARSLFWVTSTYVVCWLPFDVMLLVIIFMPQRSFKIIFDATIILAHSSFLVNAFIFSYKTENIRKPVSDFCSVVKRASGVSTIGGVIGGLRQGSLDTSASNTTVSSSIASQPKVPTGAANTAIVMHI